MMPNMEYALGSGRSLRHLDVAPMISALRFQPSDFEYAHGWLNHVPSRHRFQFDRKGRVTIDASCGCASLLVRPEQADELHSLFNFWRQSYWQPLGTTREFASPFEEPNAWLRLFRDFRMAWRRFRRQADPVTIPADVFPSATPAEYSRALSPRARAGGSADSPPHISRRPASAGLEECSNWRRRRRGASRAPPRLKRPSRGGASRDPPGEVKGGDYAEIPIALDNPRRRAPARRALLRLDLAIVRRAIDGDRIDCAAVAQTRFGQNRRHIPDKSGLQNPVSEHDVVVRLRAGKRVPIDEKRLRIGALRFQSRNNQALDRIGHVMRLIEHVGRIEPRRAADAGVNELVENEEQAEGVDRAGVEIVVAIF